MKIAQETKLHPQATKCIISHWNFMPRIQISHSIAPATGHLKAQLDAHSSALTIHMCHKIADLIFRPVKGMWPFRASLKYSALEYFVKSRLSSLKQHSPNILKMLCYLYAFFSHITLVWWTIQSYNNL